MDKVCFQTSLESETGGRCGVETGGLKRIVGVGRRDLWCIESGFDSVDARVGRPARAGPRGGVVRTSLGGIESGA